MFDKKLLTRATTLLRTARQGGWVVATAESCTGGLLSGLLTAVVGASDVFHGGVVVYENSWKENFLAIDPTLLARHGAVSREVATAMTKGIFSCMGDDAITHGVAITGLAGDQSPYRLATEQLNPKPSAKPDGLVFIAVMDRAQNLLVEEYKFAGDREAVREQSLWAAMDLLEKLWHQTS